MVVVPEQDGLLPKMPWNFERNEEKAQRYIIKLAKLLAYLRGVVPTWHTQDTQGSEYAYTLPTIEEPDSAMQQLTNLARGHALSVGRNYITMEDISIIVKVVLSTASIERVTIFSLLIANRGKLTTTQITQSLNTTNPTARRTMTELKALGLVEMKCEQENVAMQITLKPEFEWFLSSEFEQLREDFEPTDNSGYLLSNKNNHDDKRGGGLKEKTPLISQEEEKEQIFWQIYTELENEQCLNPNVTMDIDKTTVSGTELKKRLVSGRKFFVDEAYQMIEDMVKNNKLLEKVSFDTYRRVKAAVE